MNSYKRFDEEMIKKIEYGLETCNTASELASLLGIDVSGLIKHIKKVRTLKELNIQNKCGNKYICKKAKVCPSCYYDNVKFKPTQEKKCFCCKKQNCNSYCSDFDPVPNCKRIKKFPYVCNGCEKLLNCRLNHLFYVSTTVWENTKNNRSNSRKGQHASEEELIKISMLLKPLLLEKHQSLSQIMLTHKDEIGVSYPTLLSYIDKGLIPGIKNIDLTKRVKYPIHYKKNKDEPTNFAFLEHRTFDDFINYTVSNSIYNIVEMDTVLSSRLDDHCLLTLLFRQSNFMLAFLLPNKKSNSTKKIFHYLQDTLGSELYKKTFNCILTDNGTEFTNPLDIEINRYTGEKLVNVFYCDPGKSGQKGKIEKNHVELRKIFPKGTNFGNFSQDDINLALSHINSEPRAILNKNCPGVIAQVFLNDKVINLNKFTFIKPDDVFLHPNLFRK